jgi:hypothetical protein
MDKSREGTNTAERQDIIAELLDWAVITGRPLPYPAATIAEYEARGLVVDLVDGSISDAESLLNQTVALSPQGLAAYHALKQAEGATA